MAKKKEKAVVAEVCMYGTGATGAGWLGMTADGKSLGDGEPRDWQGFTGALWQAFAALKAAGVGPGLVKVFASGGKMVALADLNETPYFGELKWGPAVPLTFTFEEILAAAEKNP